MSYSPEQIEACILAYRNGDLNYCRAGIIDLLTAYAATLRQSADSGRVGDEDAARFRYIVEYNWIGTKTRCSEGIQDGDLASARRAVDKARVEKPSLHAALAAQGQGEAADAPSIEAATAMGAKGGPAVEAERLAFEAWMRGHCWPLCATWNGTSYRSDAEQGGKLCPNAMTTRGLWAAWRDRAALAAPAASPDGVPDGYVLVPREPNDAMLEAALMLQGEDAALARAPALLSALLKIYRAMLAAAPSAPEGDGGEG